MTKEEIKFRRNLRKQVSDIIDNINETCCSNNTTNVSRTFDLPFSQIEGDFIGEDASMNLIQSLLTKCNKRKNIMVVPWLEMQEDMKGVKLIGLKFELNF